MDQQDTVISISKAADMSVKEIFFTKMKLAKNGSFFLNPLRSVTMR